MGLPSTTLSVLGVESLIEPYPSRVIREELIKLAVAPLSIIAKVEVLFPLTSSVIGRRKWPSAQLRTDDTKMVKRDSETNELV